MVPMLFNSKQWHTQQQENGLRLESSNWFSFRFHSDSLAKFDQQLTRRWEKLPLFLWNPFTFDVNKRRKSSLVLSVESAAFCEKSSPPLRIAVWLFFLCDCYLYEILGTAYRATVFRLVSLVFCLFSRTKSSKITENIFEMGIGSAKDLLESI